MIQVAGARDRHRDLGAAVVDKVASARLGEHDFVAVHDAALDDDVGAGVVGLWHAAAAAAAGASSGRADVESGMSPKAGPRGASRACPSSRGRGA